MEMLNSFLQCAITSFVVLCLHVHVTHINYIHSPYNLYPVKIDFTISELLTGSSRLTQFDALVPVRFDLYVFIRWKAVKSKENTMSDHVSSPPLYPRTEEESNYIHK